MPEGAPEDQEVTHSCTETIEQFVCLFFPDWPDREDQALENPDEEYY